MLETPYVLLAAAQFNGARKNFGFATFADEEGLRRTVSPGRLLASEYTDGSPLFRLMLMSALEVIIRAQRRSLPGVTAEGYIRRL